MGATVNRLVNANVYVEGKSRQGQAEEVTLPMVKVKMATHKGLGMISEFDLPSGLDKMEAKIKWAGVYPEVMAMLADPFTKRQIMMRGSLETYDGVGRTKEAPVIATMMATAKETGLGAVKANDGTNGETALSVFYFKLEMDGKVIVEVDVHNTKWEVDGKDMLAGFKGNLGV